MVTHVKNEMNGEPDYKRLFESAPSLYMVLDPSLHIVAVSDAYCQATLTQRNEILGRYLFDVFPDNPGDPSADAIRNTRASLNRVLQSHQTDVMVIQRHDVRRPESEGGAFEVRYWSPINSPVLNPDGSLAYIIHRLENVTDFVLLKEQGFNKPFSAAELSARVDGLLTAHGRSGKKLQQSESKYRTLFESIDEGFCLIEVIFDERDKPVDYRFLEFNPAFEQQTGLFDALGRTIRELVPEQEQHWFDIYGRVARTGQPIRFVNHAAQLHRWYDAYAWRFGDPQSNQVAVLFNDITARKLAEQALLESERRLSNLWEF
jgi:PAS domain S-box-containing protein